MTIEQAMITRARPRLVAAHLSAIIDQEVQKGCSPEIYPHPVELEPRYETLHAQSLAPVLEMGIPADPVATEDWVRLRLWVSPEQQCNWIRAELFLKHLSSLGHRIGFEIHGNKELIQTTFLIHRSGVDLVITGLEAQYGMTELVEAPNDWGTPEDGEIVFRDFYPPPPYSHLLTSFEELKISPFAGLIRAMTRIEPPAVGFYQCLFQPVRPQNNWHLNVELLLDIEYAIKLHGTFHGARPSLQQAPSGDLHHMAQDLDTKAHNDRPFYCAAVRVGTIAKDLAQAPGIDALTGFMNLFQHGGRPLRHLKDQHYREVIPADQLHDLLLQGQTHRPGFLVNSRELSGLVHPFSPKILEERGIRLPGLETLSVRTEDLQSGTRIGTCHRAGTPTPVCIPHEIRQRSTHIISCSGMGKSTVILNMFLQDIQSGQGAALIDIHGDLVHQAIEIIPPEHYPRCIFFDPGDPEGVPLWNPLARTSECNIHRQANNLVASFKRVFTDWGDRLEHVLRNGIIGLSFLPEPSTLLDLYSLVRQGSKESERLREAIVASTADGPVRQFWAEDFKKDYRKSDLQAPKHKLSKLVSAGTVSLMLSQPHNRIDFRRIMNQGQILLVDLSSIGGEVAEILGNFMLALMLATALGRNKTPEDKRRPFSIFLDEAHRFIAADAIENIIVQTRKFGLHLCIAHQFLSQFGINKVDALSTTGCTLIGRVDKRDSQYFAKDLQDKVDPKEIIALEPYEMIARIGTEIVRFQTLPPPQPHPQADKQQLIQQNRKTYCANAQTINAWLSNSHSPTLAQAKPKRTNLSAKLTDKDFEYDEILPEDRETPQQHH